MVAVTEKEAKDRWCPMTRAFDNADNGSATATNRPLAYEGHRRNAINCLGSGCMFWRWMDEYDDEGHQYGVCGMAGPAVHDVWGDRLDEAKP